MITDVHARYFGTELNDQSLTPGRQPAHRPDAFRGLAQPLQYLRGAPPPGEKAMITKEKGPILVGVFIMIALCGLFVCERSLLVLLFLPVGSHCPRGDPHRSL